MMHNTSRMRDHRPETESVSMFYGGVMAGRRAMAAAGDRETAAGVVTLRRVPLQTRSRQRVQGVLDAAAELVDELGPDLVTTTMIASRSGVSVGWLYDYFVDREAIFDAIVIRAMDRLDAAVERSHEQYPGPWPVRISAVIDALAEFYRSEPGYRALWFSPYLSIEMVEAMRRHDDASAPTAVAGLAANGIVLSAVNPLTAFHLVIGIIDKGLDLAFRFDFDGDPGMIEETKRAVLAYVNPYVSPAPAAKAKPQKSRR